MLSVVSPKRKTNTEWSYLMWNLKKHQTHWNKKKILIAVGTEGGKYGKWMKVVKGYKLPVIKWINSRDVYTAWLHYNTVNHTVFHIYRMLRVDFF